jgi:hypothetical protein
VVNEDNCGSVARLLEEIKCGTIIRGAPQCT